MTALVIVLAALLLISICIVIFQFLAKNVLKTALTSLLAILSSLVAAVVAPDVQGEANIDLHLGAFGSITGKLVKISSPRPLEIWILSFLTIGILTLITLYFVYDQSRRAALKTNP